jgi:hypothetical protein
MTARVEFSPFYSLLLLLILFCMQLYIHGNNMYLIEFKVNHERTLISIMIMIKIQKQAREARKSRTIIVSSIHIYSY